MNLEDALMLLFAAYPMAEKLNALTVRVYLEDLEEFDLSDVIAALKRLRRTSKFLPTIAEIRSAIVSAKVAIVSENEAWLMIVDCMAQPVGTSWDLPKDVGDVMRSVGKSHEFRTDERGEMERRFRKAWTAHRERLIADAQAGTVPLAMISAPELARIAG